MFESPRKNNPIQEKMSESVLGARERVERVLDKIDFELLKQIFGEQRAKAGLHTETNVLSKEKIGTSGMYNTLGLTFDLPVSGVYSQPFNNIQVDPRILERSEKNPESPFSVESLALKVICHEETHAVGTNLHNQTLLRSIIDSFRQNPVSPSGVAFQQSVIGLKLFSQFNEAVTDTIAEEVYSEYLKRSGDTIFYQNKDSSNTFDESYDDERKVLKAFVAAIARSAGVPEEIVWHSIKHAYYNNLDLNSNELVQLYVEVIGLNIAELIIRPKRTRAGYEKEIAVLSAIGSHDEVSINEGREEGSMNDIVTSIETFSPDYELKKRLEVMFGEVNNKDHMQKT